MFSSSLSISSVIKPKPKSRLKAGRPVPGKQANQDNQNNHPLDSENISGLSIPQGFALIKEELIKKDKEIETLKARLDALEVDMKIHKAKKYI